VSKPLELKVWGGRSLEGRGMVATSGGQLTQSGSANEVILSLVKVGDGVGGRCQEVVLCVC